MASTRIPHSRPTVSESDIAAVVSALKSGHLAQGPEVNTLEHALCERVGRAHAVVVSSGTAALYLSLKAMGVGPGDSAIIPSYTCQCLASAVKLAGASVECADCGQNNVCLTAETVNPVLSNKTKAIIAPHMFGYLADIPTLADNSPCVIEDCAQAVGGTYDDGSLAGTRGDIAVFSFYATKLLPAGEGGACLTDDHEVAATIRSMRNSDEQELVPGSFNLKMPDINAALAMSKLEALDENIARREEIARRYDEVFGSMSFRIKHERRQSVAFRYLLETDTEADTVIAACEDRGICCRKPVWKPVAANRATPFPHTERLHKMLISVPIYPSLSDHEVETVCSELAGILSGN